MSTENKPSIREEVEAAAGELSYQHTLDTMFRTVLHTVGAGTPELNGMELADVGQIPALVEMERNCCILVVNDLLHRVRELAEDLYPEQCEAAEYLRSLCRNAEDTLMSIVDVRQDIRDADVMDTFDVSHPLKEAMALPLKNAVDHREYVIEKLFNKIPDMEASVSRLEE
jgi:hypothetical protein